MAYLIRIVSLDSGEVVETIGRNLTERQAERIMNGVSINLDTNRFMATIEEEEPNE